MYDCKWKSLSLTCHRVANLAHNLKDKSIALRNKPIGIRFSYLETDILGILREKIVKKICFHIEYSLSDDL